METHKCCICGKEFTGYGNNPAPVKPVYFNEYGDNVCCDECNNTVVIPVRICQMKTR